jgi:PAS domain S-box-containing protein
LRNFLSTQGIDLAPSRHPSLPPNRNPDARRSKKSDKQIHPASVSGFDPAFFLRHFTGIAYQTRVISSGSKAERLMEGNVKMITGYEADDFLEGGLRWKDLIQPDHLAAFERFRKRLVGKPGITRIMEYPILRKDAALCWVSDHSRAVRDGRAVFLQGTVTDITERKLAENRILHLNAVLAGIRGVNQLITHEKRIHRLLKKACDLLTESRGYPRVWIALTGPGAETAARFESGSAARRSTPAVAVGSREMPSSAKKALLQSGPVIHKAPRSVHPARASEAWGELVVRLAHGSQVFGIMGATVPLALVAEKEEHALLQEVAGDLGFALHGIALEEKKKKAERLLAEREKMLELIYANAFDGISIYEELPAENRRILIDCNQRYCGIAGRSKKELFRVGDTTSLQHAQHKTYPNRKDFIRDLRGQQVYQGRFSWIRPDGRDNTVEYVAVLVPKEGRHFVVGIDRDVTERRRSEEAIEASLREKEILLKEIHHRVKNNLQVIVSLLNLQASHTDDRRIADVFHESKNRIYTMALVHETLYRSNDFSRIKFSEYVKSMTRHILRSHSSAGPVEIDYDLDDVFLGLTSAIPCALILNELVTNALKHAFPDGRTGRIGIFLKPLRGGGHELKVMDDGIGLPHHLDVETTPTMGLSLVRILTSQLAGKLKVTRAGGTSFLIRFPA